MKHRTVKKTEIRMFLVMAVMMITTVFFAMPVHAQDTGTIIVTRGTGNEWPVDGTVFNLYKVADINGTDFTLNVNGSQVDLKDYSAKTNEEAQEIANQLYRDIQANSSSVSTPVKKSYSGNECKFENVEVGLYLLVGETQKIGNTTYTSQVSLVSVPSWGKDDPVLYEVTVVAKYSKTTDVVPTTPTPVPGTTPTPIIATPTPAATPVPSSGSGWFRQLLPNTGDEMNVTFYAVITVLAVVIAVYAFARLRKGEQ